VKRRGNRDKEIFEGDENKGVGSVVTEHQVVGKSKKVFDE
jgi:hypothetical protein